ncbi:MAG: hypothetical protein HRU38_17840 [Saccharospirillaceae bacterium]|nr:hypothetical protein [Pseudomonadales bacterium]NRB80501.1 hypothetical protein [Saccharospirillaceae bacterium]
MLYTKPMIELVMQIRKWMPSELKPDVKLANPNLFNVLAQHYHNNCEVITKALIKELFSLAGGNWPVLLQTQAAVKPKSRIKVYRGQTTLEDKPAELTLNKNTANKPKRMYRGVVIQD